MGSFTDAELNFIYLYYDSIRGETIKNIQEAVSYIHEPDIASLAESTLSKLHNISDEKFISDISLSQQRGVFL